MSAVKWLNRLPVPWLPYMALCLDQATYDAANTALGKQDYVRRWVSRGASATTHSFERAKDGALCCIVCVDMEQIKTKRRAASVLAHEAVHVKQEYMDAIGEDKPSSEFEAYVVQHITRRLINSLHQQLKEKGRG